MCKSDIMSQSNCAGRNGATIGTDAANSLIQVITEIYLHPIYIFHRADANNAPHTTIPLLSAQRYRIQNATNRNALVNRKLINRARELLCISDFSINAI